MQNSLIKTTTLGSFSGETQGGERTKGEMNTPLARHCSTASATAQVSAALTIYCAGLCEPRNPGGWARRCAEPLGLC